MLLSFGQDWQIVKARFSLEKSQKSSDETGASIADLLT
jgi:hypothetical protein